MNRASPFSDRAITQTITPEYVSEFAGITDDGEAKERLREAAVRFEDSYNAVAAVGDKSGLAGWPIYVIPSRNADMDEIRRGVQSLMRWVADRDAYGLNR